MNERTLELAKQAGLKVESFMTNPPKPFQILGSTEQFEKFAELMLKASFDVVINDGRFHDAKGIIRAGKYTAMEHFGIEE